MRWMRQHRILQKIERIHSERGKQGRQAGSKLLNLPMSLLLYMHIGETQEVGRNALLVRKYNTDMILEGISVLTAEQRWTHREMSNMRTREDAKIYRRLNTYDLDDGIGELLEAIDEELDFEEDDEAEEDNE